MSFQKELFSLGTAGIKNKSTELDSESAALLRASIRPLFTNALDWGALSGILREKGYSLAFRDGRLCLIDQATGDRVCGLKFLGFELRELVRRMGRPMVIARGANADGDLIISSPDPKLRES
ncbi:hypothetical protein [Ruegeria arenilitoris]|uniref:hypothetical protein n=1 Tax=Ruegeria arenilitoris TaxID=1173585 RepID=UPI00147DC4D4|nr:hypothetical protein [Ruegeria arenilitoris]